MILARPAHAALLVGGNKSDEETFSAANISARVKLGAWTRMNWMTAFDSYVLNWTAYLQFGIWKCEAKPEQIARLCFEYKLRLRIFWKRVSGYNELPDRRMITFLAKLAKYAVSCANIRIYSNTLNWEKINKHVRNVTFETADQQPDCFFSCRNTGSQRRRLCFYSGA